MKNTRWASFNAWIVGLFMLTTITSCQRSMSEDQLKEYAFDEKNGLVKEKQLGAINLQVNYRPTGLVVAQEHEKGMTKEDIQKIQDNYSQYHYFIISYSIDGKEIMNYNISSMNDFSQRVQQLAFGMGNKAYLTTNTNDTVPMLDSVFPRTYGVGGATQVMTIFDQQQTKEAETLTLTIEDIGLNIGTNRFRFRTRDINNTPSIKFNLKK